MSVKESPTIFFYKYYYNPLPFLNPKIVNYFNGQGNNKSKGVKLNLQLLVSRSLFSPSIIYIIKIKRSKNHASLILPLLSENW